MAARVKKFFHRKKDDDFTHQQQSPPRRLLKSSGHDSDSNVRHTLYENTVSGGNPERGQYPLGGNGSQSALAGRRSSVRSQGHSTSSGDLAANFQPSSQQYGYSESPVPQKVVSDRNKPTYNPSLAQDFSELNFRDRG